MSNRKIVGVRTVTTTNLSAMPSGSKKRQLAALAAMGNYIPQPCEITYHVHERETEQAALDRAMSDPNLFQM
ncbi:MAG: hypothetical protein K8T91_25750 [Planctomycetes bacterium]|nr:hypothetical protein [Planctomycetota bacterium]